MDSSVVNSSHLRAFIERIESREQEKRLAADDVKEIYSEAKGSGFDVKILRKIVALRRIEANKRQEEAEILDLYMTAIGMLE